MRQFEAPETESSHLRGRAPPKVFLSCGNETVQVLPVETTVGQIHSSSIFHSILQPTNQVL